MPWQAKFYAAMHSNMTAKVWKFTSSPFFTQRGTSGKPCRCTLQPDTLRSSLQAAAAAAAVTEQ
jgi:hypothetical protein